MRWRKIRVSILLIQGIFYRSFIVCCNILFFWVLTGEWKLSVGVGLLWNAINMLLYYSFHGIWAKIFRLGVD